MKKLSVFITAITLLFALFVMLPANVSYADDYGLAENFTIDDDKLESDLIVERIGPIYSVLYTATIIIAVVALTITGLTYIFGSAAEKADYKKQLIPITVGICFVAFLMTIINVLAGLANSI